MCVRSSVAAISATISAAFSAAIVNFRVRGNKLSQRKLAIRQLWPKIITRSSNMKMVNWMVSNLYFCNIWPDLKPEYHFKWWSFSDYLSYFIAINLSVELMDSRYRLVIKRTHHSYDGQEDDKSNGKVSHVGMGVDVRVPRLVDLEHTQPTYHVHERCVWK